MQFTNKLDKLKSIVKQSPYLDPLKQRQLCEQLGLHYAKGVFQEEYRKRFYNYLQKHTTTAATVSRDTKIDHKYVCELKFYFENKGLLNVVMMGVCPSTGSFNVQYLSTNPEVWVNSELLPKSDQLKLF
jgi:hypothetical protein